MMKNFTYIAYHHVCNEPSFNTLQIFTNKNKAIQYIRTKEQYQKGKLFRINNKTKESEEIYTYKLRERKHATKKIKIGKELKDIDIGMVQLVKWFNKIEGIQTTYCCHGSENPKEVGREPYLSFTFTNLDSCKRIFILIEKFYKKYYYEYDVYYKFLQTWTYRNTIGLDPWGNFSCRLGWKKRSDIKKFLEMVKKCPKNLKKRYSKN